MNSISYTFNIWCCNCHRIESIVMTKKKELLILGATAASCAAAAIGYSVCKNNKKETLVEAAEDMIVKSEVQNASSALDMDGKDGELVFNQDVVKEEKTPVWSRYQK